MSLINEALRKARQEAAEREAEEKGVRYQPPRAHLPQPSRLGMGLVLGLALGVVFAIAGGGAAWYLLSKEPDPRAASEAVRAATHEPAPDLEKVATPASVPEAPETRPPAASEVIGTAPAAGGGAMAPNEPPEPFPSAAAEPSAAPPRSRPTTAPSGTPAGESPPPSTPSPTPPSSPAPSPTALPQQSADTARPAAAEPMSREAEPASGAAATSGPEAVPGAVAVPEPAADGPRLIQPPGEVGQVGRSNVFVLEADLGDVVLELDFIVWSARKPFAQINGEQVEVGQLVEGLLVERIEKDRVMLRGADGSIVLRVR
ncbi:MAG: hypothetical protein MI919_19025 [Holophagales bacterium]|nr:hypothetical protein [Holophagales bacterium]